MYTRPCSTLGPSATRWTAAPAASSTKAAATTRVFKRRPAVTVREYPALTSMHRLVAGLSALLLAAAAGARAAATLTPDQSRARDIYKQLIEIDTTDEHGATFFF